MAAVSLISDGKEGESQEKWGRDQLFLRVTPHDAASNNVCFSSV